MTRLGAGSILPGECQQECEQGRQALLTPSRYSVAALAAAALLAGCGRAPVHTKPAGPAPSPPFTPEVARFVESYVEAGGDKLTNWVQDDKTSDAEAERRAFQPLDGLSMELVASEPVIRQPVDLHFDDRGRLWVVQYLQYPFPAGLTITSYDQYLRARYDGVPAPPPHHVRGADKITVLEDADGDGVFESHTDVITGLNITTSVLTGHGGVWVMNPPYLLLYPDVTGDGLPDGDPEVRLAGFGLEDTHSLANSLTWGPDGWLYGVHGSTSTGKVRGISFLGQAVWRYHPETDRFELVAEGGGNPWTLSFDARGRAFSGDNGGNSRGFHWVRGGRYDKNWPKHGPFSKPYSYGSIPHMDHQGDPARFAMTSVVYEDGALPGYEGQLIAGMALTSRIQASRLIPDGSTFRTVDTDTLVTTADRSFRPVDMTVGPDGAVYVADWCDIRMDHTDPRDTWDKSCGRIWRLRATGSGSPGVAPFDLARLATPDLVRMLRDRRKWYRDRARRLLGERKDRSIVPELRRIASEARGQIALEALWTANLISGVDGGWTLALLDHPDAPVRAWTLRLIESRDALAPQIRQKLVALARSEPDPEVRSELAGAAARVATADALAILQELIARNEDVSDRHIPLRIWWALEQKMTADGDGVSSWLADTNVWNMPLVVEHLATRIARRLAAERGDAPSFTRIDAESRWQEYARHPRTQMPGGKGDYTDWQTNDTPAIRDRNLTRLAQLLEAAPAGPVREKLLAGVKAGFEQGAPVPRVPDRLLAVLGKSWAEIARTQTTPRDGEQGEQAFLTHCAPCHQTDGSGMARLAVPLRRSPWVLGREDLLVRIVLHGIKGELLMPPMGALADGQIAAILTYVRRAWGHEAAAVTPETVARVRAESKGRRAPWSRTELSRLTGPD